MVNLRQQLQSRLCQNLWHLLSAPTM